MRVDFVEAKTVAEINKQPQPGHFAIDSKILDWIRCRDQFRKKISPETLGFYFSHETEKGDQEGEKGRQANQGKEAEKETSKIQSTIATSTIASGTSKTHRTVNRFLASDSTSHTPSFRISAIPSRSGGLPGFQSVHPIALL